MSNLTEKAALLLRSTIAFGDIVVMGQVADEAKRTSDPEQRQQLNDATLHFFARAMGDLGEGGLAVDALNHMRKTSHLLSPAHHLERAVGNLLRRGTSGG